MGEWDNRCSEASCVQAHASSGQERGKASKCHEGLSPTVGHRWEDQIAMPHGWCLARVPQHTGNAPIRWGSCARPGTQPPLGPPVDPHQCALYEPVVSEEPQAYAPQNNSLVTDLESIQPDAESNQTESGNGTAAAPPQELRESGSDDKAQEAEVS